MQRNFNFDLIRSLACFLVVCIHCGGLVGELHEMQGFSFYGNLLYFLWINTICSAVPFFVMLSGALLLSGKETPPYQFLMKRLKRILVPFMSWSIILFVLTIYKEHWPVSPELIPKFAIMFCTNGVHSVYWYVYMIIGLYLMTPILKPFFVKADIKQINYCVLLTVVFFITRALWKNDVQWVKGFHWSYFTCLAYYILGYAITHFYQNMKYFKLISFLLFVASLMINMGWCLIFNETNEHLQFFLYVSLFCVFLNFKISFTGTKLKVLEFISNCSYSIYLSHVVLVSAMVMIGFTHILPLWIMPLAMAVIVFLTECIGQWIIMKVGLKKYFW